ncbi:MAG: S1 RNA-binding domain-containing protein, partial [Paludibacteraceae bacterium]|nr:S1 RNA-binding domain-containing protein [Paludibacteraceae bacterium]
VEFMPGKEGLLHISEIDWKRYETMEETGLKEGDKIMIKLMEIDPKTGKFRLSARELKQKPEGYVEPERPARPERGPRPERGDRGPRPERGDRGPRPERRPRPNDFEGDGARLDRRH